MFLRRESERECLRAYAIPLLAVHRVKLRRLRPARVEVVVQIRD